MPRHVKDWITAYLGYISPASEAPLDYHLWSAVTAIGAAMKRKVHIGRVEYKLYPNLYTILVGRPGLGKGSAINPVIRIMNDAGVINALSDRVTIEYILERLSVGWTNFVGVPGAPGHTNVGMDHSCFILSRELSVFISASQFTIPILTDLWDSIEGTFIYGTRHKGEFKIHSPCVSLLGGSTQEWLISSIPSTAVGGGFTRRVNFVLAQDRERLIPWPQVSSITSLRDHLVEDMKEIGNLQGEFKFAPDAKPLFEKVYAESDPDLYDDEATTSYKTSKWAQVCKVAMVLSAAKNDTLVITKDDFALAYDLISKVAKNIPKVFRGIGESEMVHVTNKILAFIEVRGFASRQEIIRHHWRDVTLEELDRIIATLKAGDILFEQQQGRKILYYTNQAKTGGLIP